MHKKLTPTQYFWCNSGRPFKTIQDFKDALKNPDGTFEADFQFHAINGNNDFANWIRDIFEEKELAKKIRPITSMAAMRQIILGDEAKKEKTGKQKTQDAKEEVSEKEVKEEPKPIKPENKSEKSDEELREDIEIFAKSSESKLDQVKDMKKRVFEKNLTAQQLVETAQEGFRELESEISESRREGIDMFMPSLMMNQVKPMIAYLAVTGEQSDFRKVTDLLENIKDEIKDAKEFEEIDLKKEILEEANKVPAQTEVISKKEDEL